MSTKLNKSKNNQRAAKAYCILMFVCILAGAILSFFGLSSFREWTGIMTVISWGTTNGSFVFLTLFINACRPEF
jgi:hypothetical protein